MGQVKRRLTEKQIARRSAELAALVQRFVIERGGEEESAARYRLSTKLGDLHVSIVNDWIACRFEDVPRAVSHFGRDAGLNHFSGKWNWGCGEHALSDELFGRWSRAVVALLPQHTPVEGQDLRRFTVDGADGILTRIREVLRKLDAASEKSDADLGAEWDDIALDALDELYEDVAALDAHMSNGGELPTAWRPTRPTRDTR